MKLKNRIISILTAAMLAFSAMSFTAAAEGGSGGGSSSNNNAVLGSGGFSNGYKTSLSSIKKNDQFDLTVITYIPIENSGSSYSGSILNSNVLVMASHSDGFRLTYNDLTEASSSLSISGGFLSVSSKFTNIEYIGGDSTFNYTVSYNSGAQYVTQSFSVKITECVDDPKEEPSVANFIYINSDVKTVKAGESTNLEIKLESTNSGKFSEVAASLSSADDSILVEETGLKRTSYAAPRFSFRISVPKTTAAGTYNLTLTTYVYDRKGNMASTSSYTIPVVVTSDVVSAGLSLTSYKFSKEQIKAGDSFTLTLELKNDCNVDLQDVKVSLSGLDQTKFVLDGGFSSKSVTIKAGKTGKAEFGLVACKGIASVRESIPVNIEYRINPSNAATAQALSTTVIADCVPEGEKQNAGKYDITMTGYSVSVDEIKPETQFDLTVTLKNNSENDITGARISINELTGAKFAVNSGLTYADFSLKAGQSATFTFSLIGCKGITSIREVIPVEISFGQQVSTVFATVTCVPPEEKKDETETTVFAPNIIIQSYDFGGDHVTGGLVFPLSIKLKNAGSSSIIENLKVTIAGAAGNGNNGVAFSPANSSNSFFIESLGAKSTTDISIDLLPRADANPDSYPVSVTFEYEYLANGKRHKAETITETITIPLQQEDRFTINQPDFPETVGMGEMAFISASFVNKGKSDVYNVTADVVGEGFTKSTGAYYIGNVASGSEEYYDVQLNTFQEGQVNAELVVTYEDANGNQKEQRVPILFNVIAYNYGGMYGGDIMYDDPGMGGFDMPMEENNDGSLWLWIGIGGGVLLVVVIIVIIVVVRHRKKKRELEIDDEDI